MLRILRGHAPLVSRERCPGFWGACCWVLAWERSFGVVALQGGAAIWYRLVRSAVIWSVGVGEGVLLFDAGGESGFDDVDQLGRGDAGVD